MDRPVAAPLTIFARPVERIDDPQPATMEPGQIVARFLGQDRVVGIALPDHGEDQSVGLGIAAIAERLASQVAALADAQQRIARGARDDNREIGDISHRSCQARGAGGARCDRPPRSRSSQSYQREFGDIRALHKGCRGP